MRPIRKLRHWRQRFRKDAKFIFRRRTRFGGKIYKPGDKIPKELAQNRTKLEYFWEDQRIELWQFEETRRRGPTLVDLIEQLPEGHTGVWKEGTPWVAVTNPDGEERKFNGKKALQAYLDELAKADDPLKGDGEGEAKANPEGEGDDPPTGEETAPSVAPPKPTNGDKKPWEAE